MIHKRNPRISWMTIFVRYAALTAAPIFLALQAVPSNAQQTNSQRIRFEIKYKVSKEYASIADYLYCYGYKSGQDARADTNPTYLGARYIGGNANGTQKSVIMETVAPQGVAYGGWRCSFRNHKTISANGVGNGVPQPATYRGCLAGTIQGGRGYGGLCP